MEIVAIGLLVLLIVSWIILRKYTSLKERFDEIQLKHSKQEEKNVEAEKKIRWANDRISSLNNEVRELEKKLAEAEKAVDFYKNITEASSGLNADDDVTEQRQSADVDSVSTSETGVSFTGFELDKEQTAACDAMECENNNFFITGKAGTGKSYLLNEFRKGTKKKLIVLAPTGISALNISGATLHSTFGYNNLVNIDIDDISADAFRLKDEKQRILKLVSTIVIDEISMVRSDVFAKMDKILKIINGNKMPFGGKQIILFGDIFQLPPVVESKEVEAYLKRKFGGIYFFCTEAFQKGNFKFLELTINHRAREDEKFFALLNHVREGKTSSDDLDVLNSRVERDESLYDRYITLLPTKAEVEKINQDHIKQLDSPLYTYQAKITMNKNSNFTKRLESSFPIVEVLRLKVGVPAMMVSNDKDHHWVNGTLGIIKDLSEDKIVIAIEGQDYVVYPEEFTEQEITYDDESGKIIYEDVCKVVQYPLVPAYAMTIHKAQGKTYRDIVCDISKCFAYGQAYVALSRCTRLLGLHLRSAVTDVDMRVDPAVLDFYRSQIKGYKV